MKPKSKRTLTPKLRFSEFRDAGAWIDGRCGEIADVLQGYGFPERYQGEKRGLYPFYKVSDISAAFEQGNKYITKANNYIDDGALFEIGAKPVPEGTTIFAKIGEAIRSNRRVIVTIPSVIDNNVAGIKAISDKTSDEFLYYLWTNISLIDFAGGVVPAISKSAIETIPVAYSDIASEQQKIAECLGSLDGVIAAEGRKLAALRDHKRGLMQQLFPQPGETQPRLRFPEFRGKGDWEMNSLSKFIESLDAGVSVISGDRPATSTEVGVLKTSCVTTGMFNSSENKVVSDSTQLGRLQGPVQADTIIFSRMNMVALVGTNAYVDHDIDNLYLPDRLWAAKGKPNANMRFIAYVTGSDQGRAVLSAAARGSSGSMKNISKSDVFELQIAAPKTDEQKRIVDCLSSLDSLITAQAAKIDTLKQHKRSLMQQLFPAPEEEVK